MYGVRAVDAAENVSPFSTYTLGWPADTMPPSTPANLRLGAGAGSVSVRFDDEIDLTRAARGRHGGATVSTAEIMVAVARRDEMLRKAAERRLPVQSPIR